MLWHVPPSAMQPAVARIALRPNKPQVELEITGKFHDDAVFSVTYCAIDT